MIALNVGTLTLAAVGALALLIVGLILRALIRAGHDWVDAVAGLGVAAITALGWVLSYISLRGLALAHGEPSWVATLWPATIDLFALVAGVKAIRARAEARPDRYAEPRPALLGRRHRRQRSDGARRSARHDDPRRAGGHHGPGLAPAPPRRPTRRLAP